MSQHQALQGMHIKNKHATADSSSSSTSGSVANTAEEKLHPLHLKKYISKSVESLSQDEVYPEEDRNVFKDFVVGSLDDVRKTYEIISDTSK